jgi:hypothetical protein
MVQGPSLQLGHVGQWDLGGWKMRHYASELWVDFARNVVEEKQRVQMQEHIATGCKKCMKLMHLWIRFHQAAQNESSYQLADGAVRTVQAAFTGRPAKTSKNAFARLLLDNSRQPLLAGVRSAGYQPRHLLYGTGRYRIDVRIEPQLDSDQVAVIGQILNSLNPDERLGDLPVTLLKAQRVLATCRTNAAGEFHVECLLEGGFRISVELPGGQEIGLPLIDPSGDQPDDFSYVADTNSFTGNFGTQKRGTGKKV